MFASRGAGLRLLVPIIAVVVLAAVAPLERVLGTSARVVYLHGAWVWAALMILAASAVTAAAALLTGDPNLHRWSAGLGRAGTIYWLVSLLLSLLAMQAGWNGLFLEEPRWRIAVQFGVVAVLLQVASFLLQRPTIAGLLNFGFFAALALALALAGSAMHPDSPVLSSDSSRLRATFAVLLALLTMAGLQGSWSLRPRG